MPQVSVNVWLRLYHGLGLRSGGGGGEGEEGGRRLFRQVNKRVKISKICFRSLGIIS